jgi:hypothetical protein
MRRFTSTLAILTVALLFVVALAACGSSGSGASATASPAASPTVSAQALLQQAAVATATAKSASFTADVALKVQGDTAKMNATSQALLGQGVGLHAAGKAGGGAADMTAQLHVAGQTIPLAVKVKDGKLYVQYQGKWYVADEKSAGSLITPSAAPSGGLNSLGLGSAMAAGATVTYVGIETVGGVQTYHVAVTIDPGKMMGSLFKALRDPAVAKQLGQSGTSAQLQQLLGNGAQLRRLQRSLKSARADVWIGAADKRVRKATVAVVVSSAALGAAASQAQGVSGLAVTVGITLSDFDQPVSVTPPASAQPLQQLGNSLFGGMLGSGLSI